MTYLRPTLEGGGRILNNYPIFYNKLSNLKTYKNIFYNKQKMDILINIFSVETFYRFLIE